MKHSVYITIIDSFGGLNPGSILGRLGGASRPGIIGTKHSVKITIIDIFGSSNAGSITGRYGGADRPSIIGRKQRVHYYYRQLWKLESRQYIREVGRRL